MSARNFIKLRGELADGRKVFRVADELECSRDEALGVMCRWLLWVDAHCETAYTGLDWTQVDELLGCKGVFRALVGIGWVEEHEGAVLVREFDKYLDPTAKKRQLAAERIAAHRWGKKPAKNGTAKKKGGKQ